MKVAAGCLLTVDTEALTTAMAAPVVRTATGMASFSRLEAGHPRQALAARHTPGWPLVQRINGMTLTAEESYLAGS